jgi:cell division protein YceG involved in septum cleavage
VSSWRDPFGDEDPAAQERERRRAERETRRRARLAARVSPPDPTERAKDTAIGVTNARSVEAEGAQVEDAAPPLEPNGRGPAAPPPRPPSRGAVNRRRLLALLGVLVLAFVVAAVVVVASHTGSEPAPPPKPAKAAKTFDLTIPEGFRRAQIAEIAKKAGLRGSYEQESESFKGFDPAKYDASGAESLEGFLFPATYELFKHAKVGDLVEKQLDAFEQNFAGVDTGYARSKNLNDYDVLTIASMVQAEAGNEGEMKEISEVIYNRLSQGIPLGIDATTRYAVGNFTTPLTQSELADPSPYNTRVNAGLPPGPINNPGLAAIDAAANPAQGDLLYFVAKPGACGHEFFDNEADFNAAVAEYNAAREAAGGKSPTSC